MRKIILLAVCLVFLSAVTSSAAVRAEKNTYFIDDAQGSAVIKDGNKQKARDEARKMAYQDAINKAMEMFAGSPDDDMKNRVFAKSQSMVKNFKVTSENVEDDVLTITGSCSVGERAFDGVLGPEVISMLGNPRVMIVVDERVGEKAPFISVVETELLQIFEKAGYLIVDKDQAETLLALDPKKAFNDPSMLEGAAKTLRADIIIVARATGGAAHTQKYGVHMYKPSGTVQVKAVLTKTAYQISSTTVSGGSAKWGGSSSPNGIFKSGVRKAAEEIIYKIAYKMASAGSLGGTTVNIKLAGATFKDIEQFTEYLRETGQVFERSYSKELTELDLVSPKTARNVASLISDYEVSGGKVEVEGLTAQTVTARIRPAVQQKAEVKPDIQYVVINIYLDKLGENDARKIERELKEFIGTTGELKADYKNSALTVSVKSAQDSEGAKNIHDIELFLKNDMKSKGVELLVDNPEGNTIKGAMPRGILDRVWW